MKILPVKNYQEMSLEAGSYITEKVRQTPNINLGMATGGTPIGLYLYMIQEYKKNLISYKNVRTINLDEYVGLDKNNSNSYHYYMKEQLFEHIDIPANQIFLPNGMAGDLESECEKYDKIIENIGGIDLQILGIGENGHIGFNEPGTPFNSTTHIVELEESTREANARFFHHIDEVPKKAITMGIQSIMKSKEIILLVSGQSKKEAMEQLLTGKVTEEFPASILNLHSRVTAIVDEQALSLISFKELQESLL